MRLEEFFFFMFLAMGNEIKSVRLKSRKSFTQTEKELHEPL
jgi:hypothetical protein